MSGGSYDYVFVRMADAARELREHHPETPHILALADRLDALSKVMRDIEWAESGDTVWTPELDKQIRDVLAPGDEVRVLLRRAKALLEMLGRVLS